MFKALAGALVWSSVMVLSSASVTWAVQASPSSLSFSAAQGGAAPPSQTLQISKKKVRERSWAGTDTASWLSITPQSGTLRKFDEISVSVNPSGLTSGSYTASIKITTDAGGSVSIPVTLVITGSTTSTGSPSAGPSPSTGMATLSWSANTESDLAGYKIYVGNAPGVYGAPISVGNVTSYGFSNLTMGNTYYFCVTAYDAAGNESVPSTVVSKSLY